MGRPKRIIQTEYPYHITTRTNNRTFRFNKKKIMKIYAEVISSAVKKYRVKVFHLVLMANHYHMIIKIEEENLDRFFQYLNSRVAMRYNRKTSRSGHLWGGRYKSTIVSTDEHYLKCIRYIYMNPVRAGIVRTPDKWEDSTFLFHAFGKEVDVKVEGDSILVMLMKNGKEKCGYKEEFLNLFSDEKYMEVEFKKMLKRDLLGDKDFVERFQRKYFASYS